MLTMNWTNDQVLEFLHLFESEPVVWNPKHEDRKQTCYSVAAWNRIKDAISWDISIEEMKRKRDSLMAYYRTHINRMKKAAKNGEEMKPTWFAFDTMHRFLADVYESNNSTEEEQKEASPERSFLIVKEYESDEAETKHSPEPTLRVKRRGIAEVDVLEDEPLRPSKKELKRESSSTDCQLECQLYGQLLAHKLMKLSEYDRTVVMNKVDNIVFQTTVQGKRPRNRAPKILNVDEDE